MEQWFIVRTKPNRERLAAVQFHLRGLTVYLPLVWVNPPNPRAARERPFFPGYLFAQVDEQRAHSDVVRWVPGLKEIIECDGEPITMAGTFVSELRERLAQIRAVTELSPTRPRGTAPLIGEGPFAGFDGLFDSRLSGAIRSDILLACVEKEHWRLKTQTARPRAGRSNGRIEL